MTTKYGWRQDGDQWNSPDGRWAAAYIPWQRSWTLFLCGPGRSAHPAAQHIPTLKECVELADRRDRETR